nr:hypothetical protein BdHM001_06120 [Bdellovibrio sp. HM001]
MKLTLTALLICILSFSTHASAINDGQETNGGDPFVAEFLLVLDSTLDRLPWTLPLENGASIHREVLERAKTTVVFSSVDKLVLEGREVAAINQPLAVPPRIVVSRTAWKNLSEKQKTLLVLHELLPIVGIFDEDYKNSIALWQLLQPDSPLSFATMETAIMQCNREQLESVPEQRFKRMITPSQIESLIFRALDYECPAFIGKMKDWNINMDLCVGSISLTNWFLRSDIQSAPAALEILQTLRSQGVPTSKICAHKVNDSCEQVKKTKLPFQSELRTVMGCE